MKIHALKRKTLPKLAVLATGLAVAAMTATIEAIPASAHVGYTQKCNGCHSAGGSVTATPSSATPKVGAAYTVALKFTGGSSPSGFWISGNGANVTGASSTSASMKAPSAAGTYTYTVWVRAGVVASTTYRITVAPHVPGAKYATWSYIASSRQGTAVYINTLVHQDSNAGLVGGAGRVSYLQRYIGGTWQNMLSRTGTSTGRWTVGFIQTTAYPYRIVTVATPTCLGAHSGSTIR